MKPQNMSQSKKMLWFSFMIILGIALISFTAWAAKPVDTDGDGYLDKDDPCPFDFFNDADGDGICGDVDPCPNENPNDADGDGVCAPEDCYPNDPDLPVAEICDDGIDNDCDGEIDEGCGTVDTDADGYPDSIETAGIQLVGFTMADGVTTFLPYCNDPSFPDYERAYCVDPDSPDLFVIIERDPNSINIPEWPYSTGNPDPLAYVSAPQGAGDSGGLGIATHELIRTTATDQAVGGHYAVRIVESTEASSLFGLSTPGLPHPDSTAIVWTEAIKTWIDQTCKVTGVSCVDATSGVSVDFPDGDYLPLYDAFIQNVINHEIGHLISLAAGADVSAWHEPAAEGVVMEQFIDQKVVERKTSITKTLYISEDFSADSKIGYRLK